ncbi:MAG: hypothetical protein HC785_30225 [Calothrix sp. CSU_2_0]|nr:hypothetical protein [Calothrix sp. CSU_2_0]
MKTRLIVFFLTATQCFLVGCNLRNPPQRREPQDPFTTEQEPFSNPDRRNNERNNDRDRNNDRNNDRNRDRDNNDATEEAILTATEETTSIAIGIVIEIEVGMVKEEVTEGTKKSTMFQVQPPTKYM